MVGLLLVSGCQTTKKVTGTQFTHFSANPDQVVAAAEGALKDLDLETISSPRVHSRTSISRPSHPARLSSMARSRLALLRARR
jgi:hypothetical protein